MFQVQADKSRSLLTIHFSEQVSVEEAKGYLAQVQTQAGSLPPGFRLLTDLTGLEQMDYACVPYIKKAMDYCREKGVSRIVRIIPDPHKDIGFNIMSLFHYHPSTRIETCRSLEEAEQALQE